MRVLGVGEADGCRLDQFDVFRNDIVFRCGRAEQVNEVGSSAFEDECGDVVCAKMCREAFGEGAAMPGEDAAVGGYLDATIDADEDDDVGRCYLVVGCFGRVVELPAGSVVLVPVLLDAGPTKTT